MGRVCFIPLLSIQDVFNNQQLLTRKLRVLQHIFCLLQVALLVAGKYNKQVVQAISSSGYISKYLVVT
jgi:hypothetical protein